MSESKSDLFVGNMCKEGKEISLSLKILDEKAAIELLRTMHNPELAKKVGIEVTSWGFFDESTARAIQLDLIDKLQHRTAEAYNTVLNTDLKDMLDDEKLAKLKQIIGYYKV